MVLFVTKTFYIIMIRLLVNLFFTTTLEDILVSKSDILDPIDYLSDIENLVLFERAMFEDYGFKYI